MNVLVKEDATVDNTKLTKEFLIPMMQKIFRYIILMNPSESKVMLSNEIDMNISHDTFSHVGTLTNIEPDADGIPHKYEHIIKMARLTSDTSYTMNEYIQVYEKYPEDCEEVVGGVTIKHKAGDDIVDEYVTYTREVVTELTYIDSITGEHVSFTDTEYIGMPVKQFEFYQATEYDESGTVIHAAGDVKMTYIDGILTPVFEYVARLKRFNWVLIDTETINDARHTIQEPLD